MLRPVPQPSSVMVSPGGWEEGERDERAVVKREGRRVSSIAWRMLLSVS